MEAENGVAEIATPTVGGDQNGGKRPLADEDGHDAKRVKIESNGASSTESKIESKTEELVVKPLPKGTAPVKAE